MTPSCNFPTTSSSQIQQNSARFNVSQEPWLFENPIGLMTVEQLAGALGYAPKTLRNWVAKREIPFVNLHRKTFFRKESIETWLKQKEKKPWR